MPVTVCAEIKKLSQQEFSGVSYGVMNEVFSLHRDLGRLFDEKGYQNALAERLKDVQSEVQIDVVFEDFCKSYFMDLLASSGGVFELKAVETITNRNRSQLMNYLLLAELWHGKLINVRPETVEHEFVNATRTFKERTGFQVEDSAWKAGDGFDLDQKKRIVAMVRDWGTGLSRSLYEEVLIHFFGGEEQAVREVDVCVGGVPVARQKIAACGDQSAFKVTAFDAGQSAYRKELTRFLASTSLEAVQWINIARNQLSFETIR